MKNVVYKIHFLFLPIRGLSEVIGMIICTVLRKIVIESNIVTPAIVNIFITKNIFYLFLFL